MRTSGATTTKETKTDRSQDPTPAMKTRKGKKHMHQQQIEIPSIRVQSPKTRTNEKMVFGHSDNSDKQCFAFLLVFQRWVATQRDDKDCSIPSGFTQDLRRFVWHPQFDLKLPNKFHFETMGRPESSMYNCAYDFGIIGNNDDTAETKTTGDDTNGNDNDNGRNRKVQKISMNFPRELDNDVHTIDLQTREVNSLISEYMTAVWTATTTWDSCASGYGTADSASDLLFNHWFNPNKWVQEKKFILVRPNDDKSANNTRIDDTRLCPTAKMFLDKGYSQLLFVGEEMVWIDFGVNDERMIIAGMLWKDPVSGGDAATANRDNDRSAVKNDNAVPRTSSQAGVPEDFALIIAAGAPFHHNHQQRFKHDMFQWQDCHVYKYSPQRWPPA